MKFDIKILKSKLSSRKFWAALVGFFVAIGAAIGFPDIDEESVTLIVSGCAALAAYVIGEGIADSGKGRSQSTDEE